MKLKKLKVTITGKDINEGDRRCDHSCPIALAVRRKTKSGKVSVGDTGITIRGVYWKLTDWARDFVANFDRIGRSAVYPATVVVATR